MLHIYKIYVMLKSCHNKYKCCDWCLVILTNISFISVESHCRSYSWQVKILINHNNFACRSLVCGIANIYLIRNTLTVRLTFLCRNLLYCKLLHQIKLCSLPSKTLIALLYALQIRAEMQFADCLQPSGGVDSRTFDYRLQVLSYIISLPLFCIE